jgi:hypothetical protein
MCEAWFESFDAFLADMGSKPSPGHTIKRIDCDDDYRPGNCVWTTAANRLPQSNTTGHTGVRVSGRRFRAMIKRDGRRISLGNFDTAAEAGAAYQRAKQSSNEKAPAEPKLKADGYEAGRSLNVSTTVPTP